MSATLSKLPLRPFSLARTTRSFSVSTSRTSRLRQPGEPTGPNEPPSHTTSPPSKSPLKVWPIIGIFLVGGFLFKKIVDEREGQYKPTGPIAGQSPSSRAATPRAKNPVPH
jgi:hypothetical protein